MSKQFKTAGVLWATILLLGASASLVDAQSYGGGRGGAYSGGGFSSGGYGGGYGYGPSGSGYGLGSSGFYGGRLFYGDYLTGGGYPGYFAPFAYPAAARSYFYAVPAVPYSARSINYYPATGTSVSHYYAPAEAPDAGAAGAASPDASRAAVHLVLPDVNATVWFDGNAMKTTGRERVYQTPELSAGGTYQFQLTVAWMQNGRQVTQEQTIAVIPGRTTEVVFAPQANPGVPTVSAGK